MTCSRDMDRTSGTSSWNSFQALANSVLMPGCSSSSVALSFRPFFCFSTPSAASCAWLSFSSCIRCQTQAAGSRLNWLPGTSKQSCFKPSPLATCALLLLFSLRSFRSLFWTSLSEGSLTRTSSPRVALKVRRMPMLFRCSMCCLMRSCIFVKSSCTTSRSFMVRSRGSMAFVVSSSRSFLKLPAARLRRLVDLSMSLDMAGPCMRISPVMKASTEISPLPSFKMSKISGNSSRSTSSTFIILAKLTSTSTASNSCASKVPVPSSSKSKNMFRNDVSHFLFSISFLKASASASRFGASTSAFWMMIAVMRLNSTMPATPMKRANMAVASGIFVMMARTMMFQESKVMIWNSVNIASPIEPMCSWTNSSSLNVSDFVIVSIMKIPNI
mmetsp:Transcript_101157/g.290258  ORF Transcript_101157/g.290258 Transcript_101157/m.290258 type:complete len:386 (+) Transcript_101157:170-1327(+)